MKTSQNIDKKSNASDELFDTIFGIMCLIGAVLLFFDVNPFIPIFCTVIIYPIASMFFKD
ncbi:hypothetical protein CDQ71_01175 [Campylobacter hyointestinalis subsp. hyointestinalis]|nr:hypothetical protein CDQ71_01175 [Campylobacter hyointestinalis subsp. hyointestinalis]